MDCRMPVVALMRYWHENCLPFYYQEKKNHEFVKFWNS